MFRAISLACLAVTACAAAYMVYRKSDEDEVEVSVNGPVWKYKRTFK